MFDDDDVARLMRIEAERDETPSAVLDVSRAMTTGRRQRWYARSAGATLLVGALVATGLTLPGLTAGADRSAPYQAAGPVRPVVDAYGGIRDTTVADPSPAFNYSLLLDEKTGRYERVPYNNAVPSPNGSRVLVEQGDNSTRYPARAGLLDPDSGQVRWIDPPADHFFGYASFDGWSPDGRTLLFGYEPKTGGPKLALVDVDSLHITLVDFPDLTANDSGEGLSWTPDGKQIALTISRVNATSTGYEVSGIRFYDRTGRPQRTVPATGALTSGAAFSPDGTRMALVPAGGRPVPSPVTVVDTATGTVVATVQTTGADLIGWQDADHLLVRGYPESTSHNGDDPGTLFSVDMTGESKPALRLQVQAQHLHLAG